MSAADVLAIVRGAGITVGLKGGQLRATAPVGLLTPAWKAMIREHRADLVALLERESLLALLEAEAAPLAVGDRVEPLDPALARLIGDQTAVVAEVYTPSGGGGPWVHLRAEEGGWICAVIVQHVKRASAVAPQPAQRELTGVF